MDEGSSPSSGRIIRRRVRSKLDGGSRALLRQSSDEDGNDKSLRLTGDDRARLDELESSFAEKDASTQDVRQIDAELEYLDAIALRLRARRNACQAISRLPTEMVTEIIYFVAAASPPHRPFLRVHDRGVVADAGRTRSDLGWIRLAHVSRRWRSIVLQLSVLWARSVCSLIGAEEVILARARSVPLTLRLNAHHHRIDSQTVEFAQKYIHRAREIEMREVLLHPHTAVWPSGPRALAGRDFPLLESLCLDLKPSRNPPIMHDVFSLAPLRAPRLKRLELTNIFVPWAPAPNLAELILSRCDFQNLAVVPPPELLLSLLGSCPRLRKLHLLGWIPDLPALPVGENLEHAADPLDRIICLPHIEELSLTTSTRRMIAFWSRIRVPSTADVRLRLDPAHLDLTLHHPRHDPERLELVRAIGPHFAPALLSDAPRRIIGASIFDFPDEESLRFCLFTREPGQENAGQEAHWTGPFARDYGLRLDIQCYRWQMSAQNFVEMLDCVFDSFDFGRLETFEVMSHHRGHTNEWQRTLARVSSPEIISLDGMPNKDILDAIGSSLPQQVPVTSASTTEADADAASPAVASSGPSPVLFPNMRTLFLSASTEREWLADVDAQTDVIDMLQYRLDMGAPIEHLILDEIALSPVQVEADQLLRCLRQVVERVEVKKDKSAPRVSPGFLPWQGSLLIPMPQVITTPGAAGLIL